MLKELTISQVAQQAGLRTSAIRYYESVNLLPVPKRVSGQRRYNPDVLRRLSFIQVAQAAGFSLAEMQTLFNGLDEKDDGKCDWKPCVELRDHERMLNRGFLETHDLGE